MAHVQHNYFQMAERTYYPRCPCLIQPCRWRAVTRLRWKSLRRAKLSQRWWQGWTGGLGFSWTMRRHAWCGTFAGGENIWCGIFAGVWQEFECANVSKSMNVRMLAIVWMLQFCPGLRLPGTWERIARGVQCLRLKTLQSLNFVKISNISTSKLWQTFPN